VIFRKNILHENTQHEIFIRYLSSRCYKNTKFEKNKTPYMKNSHIYNIRYLSSGCYRNENVEKKEKKTPIMNFFRF
jgi:hypothetical protein